MEFHLDSFNVINTAEHDWLVWPVTAKGPRNTVIYDYSVWSSSDAYCSFTENSILHLYSCTINTSSLYSIHLNGLSFNCSFFFKNCQVFFLCGNLPVQLLNPEHFCGTMVREIALKLCKIKVSTLKTSFQHLIICQCILLSMILYL